ncbi:alpha/beta fold hydrolase [Bosea sp. 117]|uniref:alpha/beta fold hydrolase n=1 Tax=Bosea sp. 117 TaxID=1125973 RepID=UPI0004940EE7|nr:alpha/beta fold hydrolase [Bosea sp. 117]
MSEIVASDDCRIHYEVAGAGEPVVLIPGLGGDGRFWEPVAAHLADRFRLIMVDHRGAGRSDRPPGPYTIARIAADVLEIMDAEGCESAHLVGHSTGGTVVQTIALDAPLRARRIVISGSWPGPDARFRALFRARLALLEAEQAEIYQAFTHVLGYDADWIDAHEAELEAAVARAPQGLAPLDVAAARIRMLLEFDRSADIAGIRAPTLVIGARDDEMTLFRQSELLAAAIPGARLAELSGGHFYPRTRASQMAALLAGFLGEGCG